MLNQNIAAPYSQDANLARMPVIRMVAILAFVALLPSALRYTFELSSFAPGLAIVAVAFRGMQVIGIIESPRGTALPYIMVVWAACGLIAVHIYLTYLLGEPDLQRPFVSLALLAMTLTITYYVGPALFASPHGTHKAMQILLLGFAFIAVLGWLGIAPSSALSSERPLYPFTEPSHFALTVMPFLIYNVVTSGGIARLAILAITAITAVALQSLSLVVGVILAAICCLNGAVLVAFLLASLAGLSLLDLTYFTDRLDFSYENQNLSMLVYRQGIELIQASVPQTAGWGIGFQRLGFTDLTTTSSNIIYALLGDDLNLRDGGFIAAKLITEFGVTGAALVLAYLYAAIRCILLLRRVASGRATLPEGTILALACVAGLSLEMFARGAGYFTATTFLAVAALPFVTARQIKAAQHASV